MGAADHKNSVPGLLFGRLVAIADHKDSVQGLLFGSLVGLLFRSSSAGLVLLDSRPRLVLLLLLLGNGLQVVLSSESTGPFASCLLLDPLASPSLSP